MRKLSQARVRPVRHLIVAMLPVLILGLVGLPAGAAPDPDRPGLYGFQGEVRPDHFEDFDARQGRIAPTSAQQQRVAALGATGVEWNRFGTPLSLIKHGGFLATGLTGSPEQQARRFVADNAALFRLSGTGLGNLELLNVSPLGGAAGDVVLFRQRFGTLPAAQDGLLTVGVKAGKVAYVSSSVVGDGNAPAAAILSPAEGWRRAAADVGRSVAAADVAVNRTEDGWTLLEVDGFTEPQRARLVAFPTLVSTASGTRVQVVSAFETIVLDNDHGGEHPTGFTHFVDARSGSVLWRQNRVQHQSAPTAGTFAGVTAPPTNCGPLHPLDVPDGTVQITVAITATDNTNLDTVTGDLVANIVYNGTVVASMDTLGSPEVVTYTAPDSTTPSGLTNVYAAQACNFDASDGPINYVGQYATNPSTEPTGGGDNSVFPFPPQWRVFPANPNFVGTGANPQPDSTDTRELWCWRNEDFGGTPVAGCDRELENLAARQPWDLEPRGTTPTFTTAGNQAISGEAWFSPLTPAEQYRPFDLQREYDFPWTNRWFEERCSPTAFAPRVEPGSPLGSNRNDIDAATANLFAMHNRMHDWSYFLGFTERNYNLQANNFGNTSTSRENDPEIGNSQAGALTGGQPTFLGRDNANQITLNDGIAPITNMYLWQPIAAAFYAPCVDGDYDMSVIGHEYTHAISNRMVAGPDAGLSGPQAGAMGESWSDLAAVEYLNGYGFVPVQNENPFAVGPYVTGDQQAGIRNYGMNASPLNYSDIGYDITGPQVHADGEIWSATNYSIRQRLIAKYNAQFPAGNAGLQERCADGELPADQCPGNRRWIQIMFDAFLLQPSTTSMVTARDAYLAADVMRFGGANQVELWDEFARRGLGESAASNTNADPDPRPSFSSPVATNEATVTFAPREATTAGQPVPNVSLYVGRYEARATPIADNDSSTTLGNSFQLVPGTYEFVARARGYGLTRLRATVTAGQQLTLSPRLARNVASFFSGATTGGDGVNQGFLIDDTEGTNWASLQPRGTAPVNETQPQVTVDLAGTNAHTVRRVNVSAMLTLRNNQCSPENPQCDPQDTGSQNRFSALRQFQILTCNAAAGQTCNPNGTGNFQVVYTSPANAFPAIAPRPRAPELIFRTFNVPDTPATHVQLRVVHNQCTGGPDYQGDQDGDPGNNSDCVTGGSAAGLAGLGQGTNVRAAELQVFTNRLRVSGLP